MTYRIALVGCSGPKQLDAAPAQDLYTSALFGKASAWARRNADSWLILSAEHGVVRPTDIVAPYDTRLTSAGRELWTLRTAQQLAAVVGAQRQPVELVVLCGSAYAYAARMVAALSPGVTLDEPMAGMQIGERLRWLTQENAQ
jgi:hypothetical protein